MTSEEEINSIINFYRENKKLNNLVLYACTSGYPVPAQDLCLLEIEKIMRLYGNDINAFGFSGHHNGIAPDIAALTIGQIQGKNIKAKFEFIERHFTLDRTWKGTDHAASLEPEGLRKLSRDLKNTLSAISYKKEDILDIEKPTRKKLKDFGKNQRLLNNVTSINILSVNENNIEKNILKQYMKDLNLSIIKEYKENIRKTNNTIVIDIDGVVATKVEGTNYHRARPIKKI